jgi:hypothetical protein
MKFPEYGNEIGKKLAGIKTGRGVVYDEWRQLEPEGFTPANHRNK